MDPRSITARPTNENVTSTKSQQQQSASAHAVRAENPFAAAKSAGDGDIEHFFPSDPPLGPPTDAQTGFGPANSIAVLQHLALETAIHNVVGNGWVPPSPEGHVQKAVDLGPVRVASFRLLRGNERAPSEAGTDVPYRKVSLADSESGETGSVDMGSLQPPTSDEMDMGLPADKADE